MIRNRDRAEWLPAKTRSAISCIQEHIASHPKDALNFYYFITPEVIFENLGEVEGKFRDNRISVPLHAREVSHELAKLFVSVYYGISPENCMIIDVGRSATGFGWGVAVSEGCLKEKDVELVDWDYEKFLSKEAIRRMHSNRASAVRQ